MDEGLLRSRRRRPPLHASLSESRESVARIGFVVRTQRCSSDGKARGREGIGTVGWLILAALAGLGLALNFVGYFLVKRGDSVPRRWGYLAIAASTGLAAVLLGIASWID